MVILGKTNIMKNLKLKNIIKHLHKVLYALYNSNIEESIKVQNFKSNILRNNKAAITA